jgi:hypothetical protein
MLKQSPAYVLEPILPLDLVYVIHKFLPRPAKKKKEHVSPSLQKELQKIQSMELKGKIGTYLIGLDDFVLD